MASGPKMSAPQCLIENVNQHLSVNQEAIQILGRISNPVVVVAIVGLYRTGKSYLMNRLAGRNSGFPLGSTVQSETKGIWMWCVPHPTKPNHTLVLLDTEGLGDVEKGDSVNDSWIFALAVLLSSTFVYNSMGTINHQALEQLYYVTELTKLIRAKSSSNSDGVKDSTEFVSFFPSFIWTVRDFMLELKLEGQPITEDQYLQNALKLIKGNNPKAQKSNLARECIRNFFPERKCFVFDRPTNNRDDLLKLENLSEDQLDPQFQKQTHDFCSYVFTNAKVKTLKEGIVVTGNRESYLHIFGCTNICCIDYKMSINYFYLIIITMVYIYMAQRLQLPTDSLQELLEEHAACEKEAIEVFMECSFKDEGKFQEELVKIIEKKKDDFLLKNEKESDQYCQDKLNLLSKALMENISTGTFFVPGGYQLYMEARKKVEEDYRQVPRKGVKAEEVFKRFLESQAAIGKCILQSDKALTADKKTIEAEMAKRKAAEKEQELLRQKVQEQEQKIAAQEKTFREHLEQLEKKLKQEYENSLKDEEKILDHQLKLHRDYFEEGLWEKSEAANEEAKNSQKKIEAMKKHNEAFIKGILTSFCLGMFLGLFISGVALGTTAFSIFAIFRYMSLLYI
nr:guanylate-binding protein 6-like [Cavia porcellus]